MKSEIGEGALHIVGHHHRGFTEIPVQLGDQLPDQPGVARIQPRGGLVEQEELGPEHERPGNAHPLLHSSAQLGRVPLLDPRQPHPR